MEIREEIKDINRDRSKELKNGETPQMMIMSPARADLSKVGKGANDIADALGAVSDFMDKKDEQKKEEEHILGAIQRRQGKAYDEAKKAGTYTGQGWQIADVQIKAADLMNSERERIKTQFYGQSTAQYTKHLDGVGKELLKLADTFDDPVLRKHILQNTEKTLGALAEEQTKTSIAYNYKKTVDSIPQRINAVLSAAKTPEEYEQAMSDARELMKPGRFKVRQEDMDRAVQGLVDYRLENFNDTGFANMYLETRGLGKSKAPSAPSTVVTGDERSSISDDGSEGAMQVAARYGQVEDADEVGYKYQNPKLAALAIKKGEAYVDDLMTNSHDPQDVFLSDEDNAEADSVLGEIQGAGKGSGKFGGLSPAEKRIMKGIEKAKERKAEEARITLAVKSGKFGVLKSPKEEARAFDMLKAVTQEEVMQNVTQNPDEPESEFKERTESAMFTSYAAKLPRTGAVDKGIQKAFKSYLTPTTAINENGKIDENSVMALKGLRTMSMSGPEEYWMQYIDSDDKNFVLRSLSYVEGGMSESNSLRKAMDVQKQIDSGMKLEPIPQKNVDDEVQKLMESADIPLWERVIPDRFLARPAGDSWLNSPESQELKAGFESHTGKLYTTMLAESAKQYLPETRDAGAAMKRTIAEKTPYTQVIMGVPFLLERKTWADALGVNPKLLSNRQNLVHEAVARIVEESADYSTGAAVMHDVKSAANSAVRLYKRVVDNERDVPDAFPTERDIGALGRGYKTYWGDGNGLFTAIRGVPAFNKLKISVNESNGTLRVNQWNDEGTDTVSPTDIIIPMPLIGKYMEDIARGKK